MSQEAKIREITVYLPGGAAVSIPGERAECGMFPNGMTFIDERLEGGGKRRFIGLPHSITMDPPSAVQVVAAMPRIRS